MKMLKHTLPLLLAAGLASAQAHEGHGLPGSHHWHADNVLTVLALAVAALGVAWYIRRK